MGVKVTEKLDELTITGSAIEMERIPKVSTKTTHIMGENIHNQVREYLQLFSNNDSVERSVFATVAGKTNNKRHL